MRQMFQNERIQEKGEEEMTELKNSYRKDLPKRDGDIEAKISPIGDRVFCYRIDDGESVEGGIIIPDVAKEKSQEAEVVAVGPGTMLQDGSVVPLSVKKGMKVVLPRHGGTELEIKGVKYQIVHEREIIAVIG